MRMNIRKPRNDGLPIVNGRKVTRMFGRRRKFGSQNDNGERSRDDGSSDSNFLRKNIWWTALVVIALSFLLYAGKSQSSTSVSLEGVAVVSTLSVQPNTEATTSSSAGGDVYPDKCTAEQLALVEKQLPDDPMSFRHWRPASFTTATIKTSFARNPILMREFYASDQFNPQGHPFFGVIMGWQNNDVPVDTLAIGSRDSKFDTQLWNDKLGLDAKRALPPVAINSAASIRPARVLVVDWDRPENKQQSISLKSLKDSFHYSDDELALETIQMDNILENSDFSDLIRSQMPAKNGAVAADQPIHFLDMSKSSSMDITILKSFMPFLKDVRYLHFEYNKEGTWFHPTKKQLSELINELKNFGLVCYFTGTKEAAYDIWRITDCFLDHYDNHHWANIACVNVKHEDVKELATRMEKKFLETLKKDQEFLP